MTWNTVSVLCMSQLGSSEWEIQNVLAVFQVGSLLVHCPFPCDVLAVFLVGTPLLAPSAFRSTDNSSFTCCPPPSKAQRNERCKLKSRSGNRSCCCKEAYLDERNVGKVTAKRLSSYC